MLAYVFWHRPAAGVDAAEYEDALRRFHRSLARRPPSGLQGSVTLRAQALPWLPDDASGFSAGGYEDWYVLDGWDGVGVLEAAAVSRGHEGAHHEAARRYGAGTASIYRHVEGRCSPERARLAAWVTRPSGLAEPALEDLLQDGMGEQEAALWRRCLALGPAPDICVLSAAEELPSCSGLAPARLPEGWHVAAHGREAIADG